MNELITSTAGSVLLILALMACAHFALQWYTRRRCRLLEKKSFPPMTRPKRLIRQWMVATILSLLGPVALLLWIQALRFALSIPLSRAQQPWVAQYVLPATEFAHYGIATMAALIWLLLRIGRGIESRLAAFAPSLRVEK